MEQEELSAIGNELRKRIEKEKTEIERLNEEIAALITSKEADQDLDRSSDSDSADSQLEDNAELERIVQKLIEENEELERKNTELCQSIHDEREACVEVQVQIRLLEGKKSRPSAEKPREIITEISSKGPMIVSVTSV